LIKKKRLLIKLDQGRAEPDVETMDLLDFSRFVSNIKVGKGFFGFITQENFIYDGYILLVYIFKKIYIHGKKRSSLTPIPRRIMVGIQPKKHTVVEKLF
jgi:hypothetical protein